MKLAQDLEITGLHKSEDNVVDTAFHHNINLTKELELTEIVSPRKDRLKKFEIGDNFQQLEYDMGLHEPSGIKQNENRIESMLNENITVQRIKLPKSLELLEKTSVTNCDQNIIRDTFSHPDDYVDTSRSANEEVLINSEEHLAENLQINEAFELEEVTDTDPSKSKIYLNSEIVLEVDSSSSQPLRSTTPTKTEISESKTNPNSEIILELDQKSSKPVAPWMPTKWKSPVWNWFILDSDDQTKAICQVTGCSNPFVSRGKISKNWGKQALTTYLMRRHLFIQHGKKVSVFK